MDEIIIELLMSGYDLHFSGLKTVSGLHHPDSKDLVEVILLKRLPGMQRRGGSAFKKSKVSWKLLKDPAALRKVIVEDMLPDVEKAIATKKMKG